MRQGLRRKVKRSIAYTRKLHEQRTFATTLRPKPKPRPHHHGGERDKAGITVTLREQQTGELWPLVIPGYRKAALQLLVDIIDSAPQQWRLLTYSTPTTILGDMQGVARKQRPEVKALAQLDRLDLLDPSVRRHA